jgi:outer membrane immunogenic protein
MQKPLVTLVAAAGGLVAGQALAADLPWRGPPPPAPIYAPLGPPPFLWTGCYVGGNIGGAWANVEVNGASAKNSGVSGGGQFGCDYQVAEWVFGVRNMIDATNLRSSTAVSPSGTANSSTTWFDALTAREGYLIQPNVLAYVQGGAAWTNMHVTFFNGAGVQVGEISNNRTGWTAGGGVEWMFAPHWSVFAEYNFMGFGSSNIQDAQVGVNYKF